MRLQATDEDVYEMMDAKDKYYKGAALCVLLGIAASSLAAAWLTVWDLFYLAAVFFIAAAYMFTKGIKSGRLITEMKQCYLEIDKNNLVIRQASGSAGHYISGRIFMDEIEKIVEGSNRGIPGFYVILRDSASKSFFLLDDEKIEKNTIEISSFGYRHILFQNLFRRLLKAVPEDVTVISTNNQEAWFLRKPHTGVLLLLFGTSVYAGIKILLFLILQGR